MGKTVRSTLHVTATTSKNDKKTSALRKLRIIFKGVDGVTDMDMAGAA